MNRYLLGVVAMTVVAGGCANKQTAAKPQLTPIVTDIAPMPPAPVYSAPAQPVQPVALVTPIASDPATASVAAGSYTVQRGDTLYKIARERYGDGKQWTKIASANPGLSPQTLKIGQKIVIP